MECQWYPNSAFNLRSILSDHPTIKFVVARIFETQQMICYVFCNPTAHHSVRTELEQDETCQVVYVGNWIKNGGIGFITCFDCWRETSDAISADVNASLLAILRS